MILAPRVGEVPAQERLGDGTFVTRERSAQIRQGTR
jgi:hypothetical protein